MKILLTIAGMIACLYLPAQNTFPGLASVGGKGIFVLTSDTISDVKGPITAYKIERKAGNDREYSVVATLPAVTSIEDFKKRVQASAALLPFQQDLSSLRLDSIWHKGKATGRLSSLRNRGYSIPVLAGFNMVWLDEKAESGKTYQYRVTGVGAAYTALSAPVVFNPQVVTTPQYERSVFNKPNHYMALYWRATVKNKPDFIEVYRNEENGPFTKVPATISYQVRKDTVQYLIKDTAAKNGRLYNYYAKGYDVLGNAAALSDTVSIASLDFLQMPMPKQVKAMSDSAMNGIHLSWELPEAAFIKMLTVYRSTNSVKGFTPVAVLAAADTVFLDQQVKPATPYFYYFEVEYKTQDRPKRSTSFAASFTDYMPPAPPRAIEAIGTKQGVELSWQYAGSNTSGFWLYRSERGQSLQLISTMIAAIDTTGNYAYTDTDSLLKGDRFYQYVLKSFSTSHIESKYSDTVVARPLRNIPVPKPPMHITTANEDGRVFVYWEAVSNYDELVAGYKFLRSKKVAGTKETFTTDTISCATNMFADSLVKPNETYRYSVISQSVLGVQSVPATWVYVNTPVVKPSAPASLTANITNAGIQLNWELPATAENLQYNVYRYERGQNAVKAGTVSNNAEQFIDKTATKGKQYFYFIRSVAPDHTESDKSNEAIARY